MFLVILDELVTEDDISSFIFEVFTLKWPNLILGEKGGCSKWPMWNNSDQQALWKFASSVKHVEEAKIVFTFQWECNKDNV